MRVRAVIDVPLDCLDEEDGLDVVKRILGRHAVVGTQVTIASGMSGQRTWVKTPEHTWARAERKVAT
jgi:hypothetical protein